MSSSRPRRSGACFTAWVLLALALGRWTAGQSASFVGPSSGPSSRWTARQASPLSEMAGANMAQLEELAKDPEKMKKLQEEVDAMMKDPVKKKALEEYSKMTQQAVSKLQDDPELKDFFEDIKKNGMDAMKKYENDERILSKFSQATGGPEAWMQAMSGAGAGGMPPMPAAGPSYKPGDEVIIRGLAKAPELNGKKAMVVPPTSEEKKTLEGTNRLIVRLIDSGDQYAVKPENLRTTKEEADELMGSSLEDISVYNPALQSEAQKLRESGKLNDLQSDPELQPIFEDIKKNGMTALEKYWGDEKLMAKISKAMGG
mmetsp:Transcript_18741/g.35172  ORF Transcript_18741/g.35172 Transcript_18741/m.35172 type:complete len:315 (+) Transcript_18741:45-989(+)